MNRESCELQGTIPTMSYVAERWEVGDSIETYPSGQFYNFEVPDPNTICIEDIAHSLSQICRFGGFTRRFHSVAAHSLLVADILNAWDVPELVVPGFMHDFHEAYLGDRPSPMKASIPDFDRLSALADVAIGEAFGVDPASFHDPLVKRADWLSLLHEAHAFLPSQGPDPDHLEPLPDGCFVYYDIYGSTRDMFMKRAENLFSVTVP